MSNFDFSGWATRNNLRCSDGRTIIKDAFKHDDGTTVPLVWNHNHDDPNNVLGHALLENREEGVYAYCSLNNTEAGRNAKLLVKHGDVSALSIFANQLKQQGSNVLHGAIKEVSLVLAGANPGAYIDSIMCHGEESEDEAIIYTGENISYSEEEKEMNHSDIEIKRADKQKSSEANTETNNEESSKEDSEETIEDVFNTLTDKQKDVVYAMIGMALDESNEENDNSEENEGGNKNMKHNIFDTENDEEDNVISHSDMEAIFADAKRYGSLKDSVMAHGVTNIEYLFPDAQNANATPNLITRDLTWVSKVISGTHHTPFSRIKSIEANLTEDDARARGYIKGKLKKEEVFSLLKRTTTPTTIYKKQKLDRDDAIDVTDFDIVSWLKSEMRTMLDEEIARAVLVGDGRLASSDDKINEQNIRPIWTDSDLYAIKSKVSLSGTETSDEKVKAFIKATIKARKNYKGSGNPSLYTTEDVITDCLLLEDTTGRVIYDSIDKLATALRVKEIVSVPVMEDLTRTADDNKTATLMGIIVNLSDYNIGADKGGAINMFDDFDIDYNQQKYLIETRCSGALIKPYSAIVIESIPTA